MISKKMIYKSIPIIIGIVIGAVITYVYVGGPKNDASTLGANDEKMVQEIVDKLSKLMILPQDDKPVVATINDAATLSKQQPFYAGAQNGDVLLVFQKTYKAVIYSPSRNIIVNVGFVTADQNAQATSVQSAAQAQSETKSTTASSSVATSSAKKK